MASTMLSYIDATTYDGNDGDYSMSMMDGRRTAPRVLPKEL